MAEKYLDYEEKWFQTEAGFKEELEKVWKKNWGVASEVGKLESVLLRRPGKEVEGVTDPEKWRWESKVDPDKMRAQHDALAEVYKENGADVYYVEESRRDRPNALFLRDLVFMTPEGVILGRPAIEARSGEQEAVARTLAQLGVPILNTVHGQGVFEGACAMWVDETTVLLGEGVRANREGLDQVKHTLETVGVTDFINYHIPFGHAHIDGIINFVDKKKAVMFPWQTSYNVWKALTDKGYKVIEAPSIDEVKMNFATNVVALEPGKVVMPEGSPKMIETLKSEGVTVVTVEMSELLKARGGPHCMTAFLNRRNP